MKNGSYTDQNGAEKNRYYEVGVLLATPHASQLLIKVHATASSEPKLVSVFLDEGVNLELGQEKEVPKDIPEGLINMEAISF